jgi:hypothetical protein
MRLVCPRIRFAILTEDLISRTLNLDTHLRDIVNIIRWGATVGHLALRPFLLLLCHSP